MVRVHNPFRATLGSSPPYLAGRQNEIQDFDDALANGPGTHERISLVTGLRGVGKTVLLNEFEDVARVQGWWVISETATANFTERIKDAVFTLASKHLRDHEKVLTGIAVPQIFSIQFADAETYQLKLSLRQAITDFLDLQAQLDEKLGQGPVGLLITVDELHYSQSDEIREFGATVQHLVREDREIAVAMAGIPQAVKPLLASDEARNPVTFLRRANKIELGLVSDDEVKKALDEPLTGTGFSWDPDALGLATKACGGYPFMIQLMGQQAFLKRNGTVIDIDSAKEAKGAARRKLGQLVHAPALADLSDVDRTFLLAMAQDDGPSRMADISERLGIDPQYAGTYRRRLIEAEMIASTAYGYVDFELPYMREYLLDHVAAEAMGVLSSNNGPDSKDSKG
ncbi:ATP-binding protein [Corynebacterium cystitidis]|nr:ATP-binding protein [Corynebacterium cystitidis]